MYREMLEHKQHLDDCKQQLTAAHARVATLENEFQRAISKASVLTEQKQQAEALLEVVSLAGMSCTC